MPRISLNRTPPPQAKTQSPSVYKTPVQHGSDSNLTGLKLDLENKILSGTSSLSSVASRSSAKRKERDEISRSELIDLFESMKADQDAKFDTIVSNFTELRSSLDLMGQKFNEVLGRLEFLEEERQEHSGKIEFLENRVEVLERHIKGTSIEIKNIPQAPKESKEDTKNLVMQTAEKLNITLDSSEIRDVYRLKLKSGTNPIIADFTTVFIRDKFLTSFKRYNKDNQQDKFNTTSLNISGPSTPVYVSENLTQKDRRLFYLAREFAKNSGYQFCWTAFGKIFIRETEGSPQIRIFKESDLVNLASKKLM